MFSTIEHPTEEAQSSIAPEKTIDQRTDALSDSAPMRPLEDTGRCKKGIRGRILQDQNKQWTEAELETLQSSLRPRTVAHVASVWGVSPESLRRLGVGFDTYSVTFPMRGGEKWDVVGQRRRALKDLGSKHAAKGSTQGLFIPQDIQPGDVELICEGESDTAAALTLGFAAIGRPGATACIDDVVRSLAALPVSCPTIIADNDPVGVSGAEKLAEALKAAGIPCRIVKPPDSCGDLREWHAAGLTAEQLHSDIDKADVLYPDDWPPYFFPVPNALLRRGLIAQAGTTGLAVLMCIASYRDSNGYSRVSRAELADLTGLSKSTIDRTNEKLRKLGLLTWKRGGTARANVYRVNVGPQRKSR